MALYVGSMQSTAVSLRVIKHVRQAPLCAMNLAGFIIKTDICMGCGMCIAACPFGVPEINPTPATPSSALSVTTVCVMV